MKKFKVILFIEDYAEWECEANTADEVKELMNECLSHGEFIQSANDSVWARHSEGPEILSVEEVGEEP